MPLLPEPPTRRKYQVPFIVGCVFFPTLAVAGIVAGAKWLDIVAGVGFVGAIIALPFSFYYFRRAPIPSALLFGIPLAICFVAADTSEIIARDEVLSALNSLADSPNVTINGRPVANSREVLLALKALDQLPAHHSHPTKRINVEITDHAQRIRIVLARDSTNPREYWVFYPKYYVTKSNEIGRIKTPLFDEY
jgi:hypothetical protein